MPEETFERPQIIEPETPTRGRSSSGRNWPKVILAAVLGFTLLFGAAYVGYRYGIRTAPPVAVSNQQVGDEESVKKVVLENISTFENIEDAEISFDRIEIRGSQAVVDVFIRWGKGLGVGYRSTLVRTGERWSITSRERTIVE